MKQAMSFSFLFVMFLVPVIIILLAVYLAKNGSKKNG